MRFLSRPNGRRQDHGKGPCAYQEVDQKVYADEGQHSSRFSQNSDSQVSERDGPGHEGKIYVCVLW